eukprot:1804013-Amphidinium_carterae.1
MQPMGAVNGIMTQPGLTAAHFAALKLNCLRGVKRVSSYTSHDHGSRAGWVTLLGSSAGGCRSLAALARRHQKALVVQERPQAERAEELGDKEKRREPSKEGL